MQHAAASSAEGVVSGRGAFPTAPLLDRVRVLAADIKLAHSVFALPFALLAAVMALTRSGSASLLPLLAPLALVVGAMVSARTAAMVANRLLDREIDAKNPRTAGRAIPSGRASARDAVIVLIGASAVFVGVCALFGLLRGNWWPLALSLPVLAWICVYGLLKRVTWACHLWLGASLAMSVPAAALAVDPASLGDAAIWWLAGAVMLWVAGFDVIYSLQDEAIDRGQSLHSLPSRLGAKGALRTSRALHAGCVACFAMAWWCEPRLGALFAGAVAIAALLLIVEHATVRMWGTSRLAITFFTINGCVSLLVGGAGIVAVLLRAGSA